MTSPHLCSVCLRVAFRSTRRKPASYCCEWLNLNQCDPAYSSPTISGYLHAHIHARNALVSGIDSDRIRDLFLVDRACCNTLTPSCPTHFRIHSGQTAAHKHTRQSTDQMNESIEEDSWNSKMAALRKGLGRKRRLDVWTVDTFLLPRRGEKNTVFA